MLKKCISLLLLTMAVSRSFAQTPLPYFTDFETTTQRAGWTQYAKGNISTYTWTLGYMFDLSASPTLLESPNTEFAELTDTVIQWYVSPPFNFHTGGRVDSFSILSFQAGGMANASDSIVLYLLQGAPDPSLATSKLRLANLTRMTKGFGAPMRDTGNFAIPPTPGTSYIAFKYYSVHDWFQVYIDSIYISGNPLTITQDPDKSENPVKVYPNPANTTIGVLFTNKSVGHTTVSILNAYGKEIFTRKYLPGASTADIAINQLPSGIYYLGTTTDGAEQNFQKFEIVR